MSEPANTTRRDELEALLPFYLTGTLEGDDLAAVEEWLASDASAAEALAEAELEFSGVAAANEALQPPADALARFNRMLEAEAGPQRRAARTPLARLWRGFMRVPSSVAWGAAAVAMVLLLVQAVLQPVGPGGDFELAGAGTSDTPFVLVVFTPETRVAEVAAFLADNGASLIAGPAAGGVFKVAVSADTAADYDRVVGLIAAQPFAESVVPGGNRPMAARGIAGLIALWAVLPLAALPAAAQTNDPSISQRDLDCMHTEAAGSPCGPDGGPAMPGAVAVPDLIVDLFPNPQPADAAPPAASGAPSGQNPAAPAAPVQSSPLPAPPPGSLAAAPPVVAPVAIAGEFVPDEVLVTVDGDGAAVSAIATAFGLEIRSQRVSTLLGATVVRFGIPDGRPVGVVLAQLAGDARTRTRAPNHVYDLQQAAGSLNYAFQRIALKPDSASGKDVRIAVIDTAIDETHPALTGVVAAVFDAMPGVEVTARDHGTAIAGLIAGVGDMPGMAPGSRIYHARAFEGGRSTMDIILAALDWAAEQDVRIINMSFVGPKNDVLEAGCAAARERDMVLVAAAGNNGPKAPFGYPAAYDSVIAVTATDDRDGLMEQANRGPYVFVAAPGVNVMAPVGGGQDLVTGTSFSAAIVSGTVATLIHNRPDRSADWIEGALSATAKDLGKAGRDTDFGYGLIDAAAADAVK